MLCASESHSSPHPKSPLTHPPPVSGEAPTVPVASKKSGHVYEKRLIESHLAANHTDPITGEELDASDLIALQSPRVVKPRPPTLTSIPALLSTFQNEWDALMFETYTLKQMVTQAKQELSTALYENDAAVRVIARVTRERNEARDALSKMGVAQMRSGAVVETATNGQAGEAMQVDGQGTGLPKEHAEMIDEIQARWVNYPQCSCCVKLIASSLSKARRKRPVPETWTPVEKIQAFAIQSKETRLVPNGSKAMATDTNIDKGGMQVVLGGNDGSVCIYNFPRDETMRVFDAGQGMVNDCLCVDFESKLRSAFALATGEVKLFDSDNLVVAFTDHAGSANALALHPGGQILASVGDDKTVVLYDVFAKTKLTQFATDHCMFTRFQVEGLFANQYSINHVQVPPRWCAPRSRLTRRHRLYLHSQERQQRAHL